MNEEDQRCRDGERGQDDKEQSVDILSEEVREHTRACILRDAQSMTSGTYHRGPGGAAQQGGDQEEHRG